MQWTLQYHFTPENTLYQLYRQLKQLYWRWVNTDDELNWIADVCVCADWDPQP